MENFNTIKELRGLRKLPERANKKTLMANVMKAREIAKTAKPVEKKVVENKMMTEEKKEAPVIQATQPEVKQPEPKKEIKGILVGFESGKPFYRIVGSVSDIEYLSIVKYAELQFKSTLDLLDPAGNRKIIEAVRQLRNDPPANG